MTTLFQQSRPVHDDGVAGRVAERLVAECPDPQGHRGPRAVPCLVAGDRRAAADALGQRRPLQ